VLRLDIDSCVLVWSLPIFIRSLRDRNSDGSKRTLHYRFASASRTAAARDRLDPALCDRIYYDIKTPDPVLHKTLTGRSNCDILANLHRLAKSAADKIVIRMVIAAGLNDSIDQVRRLRTLANELGIRRVELNPFHPYGSSKADAVGMPSSSPGREAVPGPEMLAALRREVGDDR